MDRPISIEELLTHQAWLGRLARCLVSDPIEAEDLVQDTLAKALSRPPIATGASPRSWLRTVLTNLFRQKLRERGRDRRHEPRLASVQESAATVDVVARTQLQQRLVAAVLELEEPYRRTVLARFFDGESCEAIAGREGLPGSTVRNRLHRGLQRLRERLGAEFGPDRSWLVGLAAPATVASSASLQLSPPLTLLLMKTTRYVALAACLLFVAGVGWLTLGADGGGQTHSVASLEGVHGQRRAGSERPEIAPKRSSMDLRKPDHEILAAPTTAFRGRVVTSAGKPVECSVRLYRIASASASMLAGETSTAKDGRFEFARVVPRGQYALQAGIGTDHPTHRFVFQRPAAGAIVDLGDIVLEAGPVLIGRVLDPSGAPIAGAVVRALDLPVAVAQNIPLGSFDPQGAVLVRRPGVPSAVVEIPRWAREAFAHLPIPAARSDARGRFRILGLGAGVRIVTVRRAGFAALTQATDDLRRESVHDLGDLTLRPGRTVRGRVVDASGAPVEAAEVLAAATSSRGLFEFASRVSPTNAGGEFLVHGMPAGSVTLAARRSSADAWSLVAPQSIAGDVLVRLPARHRVEVQVTGENGRAVGRPELRVFPGGARGQALAQLEFLSELNLEGRIRKLGRGRIAIEGLAPGAYRLLAVAPGHGPTAVTLRVPASESVAVVLPPEAVYRLQVLDPGGNAVVGARVERKHVGDARVLERFSPVGRTDADGFSIFTDAPKRRLVVRVEHPMGNAVATLSQPGDHVLRIGEHGAIAGVLTVAGEVPKAGSWAVVVRRVAAAGEGMGWSPLPPLVAPDAMGRFQAAGLLPGRYRLWAVPPPKRPVVVRGLLNAFVTLARGREPKDPWVADGGTTVVVRSGAISQVELDVVDREDHDSEVGSIEGVVRIDARGAKELAVRIQVGSVRRFVGVAANGHYSVNALPAGRAVLEVVTQSQRGERSRGVLHAQAIEVIPAQVQTVNVELVSRTLRGSVVDKDGQPVAGCRIQATGRLSIEGADERRVAFYTVTDRRGRFALKPVPVGRYDLNAWRRGRGAGSGRGETAGIEVADNGATEAIEIPYWRTVDVAGRVRLAGLGKRREDLRVQFRCSLPIAVSDYVDVAPDGSFATDELIPGTYAVRLYSGQNPLSEVLEVQIGDEGNTDIRINP